MGHDIMVLAGATLVVPIGLVLLFKYIAWLMNVFKVIN